MSKNDFEGMTPREMSRAIGERLGEDIVRSRERAEESTYCEAATKGAIRNMKAGLRAEKTPEWYEDSHGRWWPGLLKVAAVLAVVGVIAFGLYGFFDAYPILVAPVVFAGILFLFRMLGGALVMTGICACFITPWIGIPILVIGLIVAGIEYPNGVFNRP